CALAGVKRTWLVAAHMSAFDPKRTLAAMRQRWVSSLSKRCCYGRTTSARCARCCLFSDYSQLFRQPGLAQAAGERSQIVCPIKREPIRKLGDAQRRIELTQMGHRSLGL